MRATVDHHARAQPGRLRGASTRDELKESGQDKASVDSCIYSILLQVYTYLRVGRSPWGIRMHGRPALQALADAPDTLPQAWQPLIAAMSNTVRASTSLPADICRCFTQGCKELLSVQQPKKRATHNMRAGRVRFLHVRLHQADECDVDGGQQHTVLAIPHRLQGCWYVW